MRAPAMIKMLRTGDTGGMALSTAEERQIPAWKVALLRAREVEAGDELFDAPKKSGLLNDLQRREIEDRLDRELPRLSGGGGDDRGRARGVVSPFDARGRILPKEDDVPAEAVPDTSYGPLKLVLVGGLVLAASLGLVAALFLAWLLGTAIEAL